MSSRSDREISIILGVDAKRLRAGLRDASVAMSAALGKIGVDSEALGRLIETSLKKPHLLIVEGITAAIGATVKAVSATQKYYDQLGELSAALGMTLEDTAAMQVAAKSADVEWAQFAKVIARISADVAQGGDKLEQLGVAARDASGNVRPMSSIVADVLDKLHGLKAGSDQAAGASLLLGKNWIESRNILNMTSASIADAVTEVRQLGLADTSAAIAAQQLEDAQIRMTRVFESLQLTLGAELLPTVADMATEFAAFAREHAPAARVAVYDLVQGLKIGAALVHMSAVVWRSLGHAVQAVSQNMLGIKQVLTGDLRAGVANMLGAVDEMRAGFAEAPDALQRSAERINAAWDAIKLGPQAALVPLVQPTSTGALGKSKEELAAEERARKDAKRDADQRAKDAKANADELQRIEIDLRDHALDAAREAGESEIVLLQAQQARKADLVRSQLDLINADAAQRLAAGLALEAQDYDLAQRAEAAKVAGYDRDSEAYRQYLARISAMEQEHVARVTQLHATRAAADTAEYRSNLEYIGGLSEQMFAGMLRGTGTFAERFSATLTSLAYGVVERLFAMMVERAIAAAVTEVAITKAAALSQIASYAAVAGAGAAASQSAIPVIGPGLAIGAMTTTSGAVLGAMGTLNAAAKGYDVGNDNPITQLHKREMVLPQELADKIRNMSGSPTAVHVTIQALDGASVSRVVSSPDFARALRNATREGRL